MKRRCIGLPAYLLLAFLLLVTACSEKSEVSVLYVLEELEAASSIEDPEERIDRLEIFIGNNPDSRYRTVAYNRILETMVSDLSDYDRALEYFEGVMEREMDPYVRGMLHYEKFAHLWKNDREGAIALAGELIDGPETYYRLFLYISYYLVWDDEYERYADLARSSLTKAIDLAANDAERDQASAILGSLEKKLGNTERALEILEPLAGTYDADESLGDILWEKGEREQALEAYVRLAAVIPGAIEERSIDSLYALVYPDGPPIEERIWEKRIVLSDELPPQTFVDIEGKRYDLGRLRGTKLVVNIWQPT